VCVCVCVCVCVSLGIKLRALHMPGKHALLLNYIPSPTFPSCAAGCSALDWNLPGREDTGLAADDLAQYQVH
jgi:hypothetical protein